MIDAVDSGHALGGIYFVQCVLQELLHFIGSRFDFVNDALQCFRDLFFRFAHAAVGLWHILPQLLIGLGEIFHFVARQLVCFLHAAGRDNADFAERCGAFLQFIQQVALFLPSDFVLVAQFADGFFGLIYGGRG